MSVIVSGTVAVQKKNEQPKEDKEAKKTAEKAKKS